MRLGIIDAEKEFPGCDIDSQGIWEQNQRQAIQVQLVYFTVVSLSIYVVWFICDSIRP